MHQKLVPVPYLILVNNPKQPLHSRNYFENRYLERELSKNLKKVHLFFLSNPVPFNRQNYQTTSRSSVAPLLVMYYLTKFDDII